MTEFPFRACKRCHEILPIEQFRLVTGYRRHTCNQCINLQNQKLQDAERYRQFNALVRWPVPDGVTNA